ncbi:MAG: hypothetical protein U0324_31930 [Polyangiales bacterium]
MRARFAPLLALALAACSEDPLYACPDAATTLQGACTPLGLRCQWPSADAAAFVTYCTCAGTGESGAWTCNDFRRVNPDAGFCPTTLPANGERCDWPTAQPCALTAGGCAYRCECVPRVGVVTPPTWRCTTSCAGDAGARDASDGG